MSRIELVLTSDLAPIIAGRADAVEVWRLGADGQPDSAHPLPPGRMTLTPQWPGAGRHIATGHLAAFHLAPPSDGHLNDAHLLGGCLSPSRAIRWRAPRDIVNVADIVLAWFAHETVFVAPAST